MTDWQRFSNPSTPTRVEARQEITKLATEITGMKPDKISDLDIGENHINATASYKQGGNVRVSWSDFSGWQVQSIGFGWIKLPARTARRIRELIKTCDVEPPRHSPKAGRSFTWGTFGPTDVRVFANQVFKPIFETLR